MQPGSTYGGLPESCLQLVSQQTSSVGVEYDLVLTTVQIFFLAYCEIILRANKLYVTKFACRWQEKYAVFESGLRKLVFRRLLQPIGELDRKSVV